jgi:hypothetical protein
MFASESAFRHTLRCTWRGRTRRGRFRPKYFSPTAFWSHIERGKVKAGAAAKVAATKREGRSKDREPGFGTSRGRAETQGPLWSRQRETPPSRSRRHALSPVGRRSRTTRPSGVFAISAALAEGLAHGKGSTGYVLPTPAFAVRHPPAAPLFERLVTRNYDRIHSGEVLVERASRSARSNARLITEPDA